MPKSPKPSRRPAVRSRASASRPSRSSEPFAPAEVRARHDGWTRDRQTGFIQALAESGCVEEACAAVGMSRQSAYRLRARIDAQGFRVAWDHALDYAIRRLSDACFSRALHGEVRPIFYRGEQIGERRVHDNKLAMFMLRYRDPLRYAATLDQMVYTGHVERAAIDLGQAIHRVADEADGIRDDDPPVHQPYTTEAVSTVRARQTEQEIIAGDGPIYGSYDRRRRLEEARRAHRLKESGYRRQQEWHAAEQAERDAAIENVIESSRRHFHAHAAPDATDARGARAADVAHGPETAAQSDRAPDRAHDVASPSSPSADPPAGERPRTAVPRRREPSIRSTA